MDGIRRSPTRAGWSWNLLMDRTSVLLFKFFYKEAGEIRFQFRGCSGKFCAVIRPHDRSLNRCNSRRLGAFPARWRRTLTLRTGPFGGPSNLSPCSRSTGLPEYIRNWALGPWKPSRMRPCWPVSAMRSHNQRGRGSCWPSRIRAESIEVSHRSMSNHLTLAAFGAVDSVSCLTGGGAAQPSTPGILFAALSLAITVLSLAQRGAGRELRSKTAVADSATLLQLCSSGKA